MLPPRHALPYIVLTLCLVASGCSDPVSGTPVGGTDTTEPLPDTVILAGTGAQCTVDDECASGICLLSEYAPFGVCTTACDTPKSPCDDGESFCVDYSDEFLGPIHVFCVPLCETVDDCRGVAPEYETCEPPSFKGNEIYPALPISVCQNPSSAGKLPIDPESCAFEYDEGSFPEAPSLCEGYCEYLVACQHAPDTLTTPCCEWGCYDTLTQGETALDEDYKATIRCYVDHYEAFGGTVCEAGKIEAPCGGSPSVPSP